VTAGFYDLFGVAVGAASGVLAAHQQRFDGVGILVLATVTAVGGGTLRDLLLGVPVFWVAEPARLWTIVAAAIVTVEARRLSTAEGHGQPRARRLRGRRTAGFVVGPRCPGSDAFGPGANLLRVRARSGPRPRLSGRCRVSRTERSSE